MTPEMLNIHRKIGEYHTDGFDLATKQTVFSGERSRLVKPNVDTRYGYKKLLNFLLFG